MILAVGSGTINQRIPRKDKAVSLEARRPFQEMPSGDDHTIPSSILRRRLEDIVDAWLLTARQMGDVLSVRHGG